MNSIELATDLNNKGALSLMTGDPNMAFRNFEDALDIIQHYQFYLQTQCSYGNSIEASPTSSSQLESSEQVESLLLPCTALVAPAHYLQQEAIITRNNNNNDELGFSFKKPFIFTPGVSLSPSLVEAYTSVLMYNLGLVYHHYYYQPRESSRLHDSESISLRMYDQCLHHLYAALPEDPSAFFNLIIATMNNKAQLHHARNEFDVSRKILDQLGAIIGSVENDRLSFDEGDVNGLVTNVTCQHALAGASAA